MAKKNFKNENEQDVYLAIRSEKSVKEQLQKVADNRKVSMSYIIKELIENYLKDYNRE